MEEEARGPASSKVKPAKAKKRQKASVQVRGIDIDYSLSTTKSQIMPKQLDKKRGSEKPSVSEIFSEQIIKRAPPKMINFTQGHIVLAYSDMFAYFRVQWMIERAGSDVPE